MNSPQQQANEFFAGMEVMLEMMSAGADYASSASEDDFQEYVNLIESGLGRNSSAAYSTMIHMMVGAFKQIRSQAAQGGLGDV